MISNLSLCFIDLFCKKNIGQHFVFSVYMYNKDIFFDLLPLIITTHTKKFIIFNIETETNLLKQ